MSQEVKITMSPEVTKKLNRRALLSELRKHIHDWIEETKMDLYPDPHSCFYEGYLQALDEVLDYVAGKEEQNG